MKRIQHFENVSTFEKSVDVIVVGLGGAGACATLEAKRAGADVLVLERASGGGGSTMLSACEMYLGGSGGTRLQKDLGIEDSTENFYNYLMASFGDHADEARIRVFAEGAAEHFDWIEAQGISYKRSLFSGRDVVALTGDSLQYSGNERAHPYTTMATPVPRAHLPADAGHDGGKVVMGALLAQVQQAGVDTRYDARVTALVQDKEGRVRGVAARVDNQTVYFEARRGVILCLGGFVMNEAMTKQHIPRVIEMGSRHGNPNDQGDGILMGVAAGGNAINMGEAFFGLATYPPSELTYGILVNGRGQRFVNEDSYLSRLGYFAFNQETDDIFMFLDNKHFGRPDYLSPIDIVGVGETVEEVEAEAGLPEGALVETVAYYNRHAAQGRDPLFHKAANWLEPFVTPPYALVSYKLSVIRPTVMTLGGLSVNPTGEVLTPDGDIISGLYAAGRTAAGVPRTMQGYNSGMSVADATFFGRLAGRQAAAHV